jgi:hypothetical protein
MRLILLLTLIFSLEALPSLAFDPSEYRQNTYGPPNHYCDPARSLGSNGSGTLGDPWNMSQCAALPVAGDVVGVLPGISVRLQTTNNDNIPAFNPSNSGTVNNRIIYVTRYAAVALPNVEINSNRTELRHNGSPPSIVNGVGSGTGCPMYGAYGRNYITFDGFYVDMAQAYMKEDSGVIRPDSATGIHFRNFVIKGATLTVASNPVIYRPQNARDTVLSNFRAYDFINNPIGSATPQGALFSDQYGDQNFLIEHFEIRNTQRGIFLKGTAPGPVFNYGTIRYGSVSNVSSCYQFNDLDGNNLTTLEYALCYDVTSGAGIVMSSETTAARNLLIHHATVARVNSANIETHGCFYSRANGIGSNVTIRDIVCDINSGTFGHGADFAEVRSLPAMQNYNGYTRNGSTVTWAFNNTQYNGLTAWQSATGRDTNGFLLPSNLFVDRANGNFRISTGHMAKTASSTGGEIGAYAGNRTVGVDTAGTTGDLTPPTAPAGLRIQ